MFDAIAYAEHNAVDLRKTGKNIRRDNFGINCVFCGDDPSYHMNIAINGLSAKCYRCGTYRYGERKVAELLKQDQVSSSELQIIMSNFYFVGEIDEDVDDKDKLDGKVRRFNSLWNSFYSLKSSSAYLHRRYLEDRNIHINTAHDYGFKAGSGDYEGRIILPVKDSNGYVVSFIARSISAKSNMRYKNCPSTLSIDEMSKCLFGFSKAQAISCVKYSFCIVTEGPFDAWNLLQYDIPAVALMKMTITDDQLKMLSEDMPSDVQYIIALDSTCTDAQRKAVANRIGQFRDCSILRYDKVKDIGEMNAKQIKELALAINKTYNPYKNFK